MHRAFLLAGPPTCETMWRDVASRLTFHGLDAQPISIFGTDAEDPTVDGCAQRVAQQLMNVPSPTVLIAHGTAIPVAREAVRRISVDALVLCNGPLDSLDPVTSALCRLSVRPSLAARTFLHPRLLLPWLASSIGLRRTVTNPYVMDRDTVVAICEPLFRDFPSRSAVAEFFHSLPNALENHHVTEVPTLLCWGDEDRLYPRSSMDNAFSEFPNGSSVTVPGGRHFHPVERPWATADLICHWLGIDPTTTEMS